MEPEDYRPRPHDHLVEPFFGGLGAGAPEAASEQVEEPAPAPGLLASLRRLIAGVTRTSRAERD